MSVRPILRWPDPVLTRRAAPVGPVTDTVRNLVVEMFETMYAAPGRGLAAPQIGVGLRIFVMDAGWKEGAPTPLAFIDPEIVALSDEHRTGPEGCLSLPGAVAEVDRAARAQICWRDDQGRPHMRWFDGFEAVCVQHEYDHLDGLLTFDRIAPEAAARLKSGLAG